MWAPVDLHAWCPGRNHAIAWSRSRPVTKESYPAHLGDYTSTRACRSRTKLFRLVCHTSRDRACAAASGPSARDTGPENPCRAARVRHPDRVPYPDKLLAEDEEIVRHLHPHWLTV